MEGFVAAVALPHAGLSPGSVPLPCFSLHQAEGPAFDVKPVSNSARLGQLGSELWEDLTEPEAGSCWICQRMVKVRLSSCSGILSRTNPSGPRVALVMVLVGMRGKRCWIEVASPVVPVLLLVHEQAFQPSPELVQVSEGLDSPGLNADAQGLHPPPRRLRPAHQKRARVLAWGLTFHERKAINFQPRVGSREGLHRTASPAHFHAIV
mmetsp:Transcript_34732/g.98415  ORF Transcript_34732/g.98415 Transcript_34732/m.98415 type:complete len:208 (-) Transcript_34732:962-1585(-)